MGDKHKNQTLFPNGSDSSWWGEADDEAAREDAPPPK